jgi:uncharacterized 2Fe-2S/4Fe-4S cluster protein (DUF4445 family)
MNRIATVPAGSTVLDAIRSAGVQFEAICGGEGLCGKCRVIHVNGEVAEDRESCSQCLSIKERSIGYLLACNTQVWSDAEFTIPVESRIDQPQILISSTVDGDDLFPSAGIFTAEKRSDGQSDLLGPSVRISNYQGRRPDMSRETMSAIIRDENPVSLAITSAGGTPEVMEMLPGEAEKHPAYGLALDLGTTTIAAILVNLRNGSVVATASALNRQITFGEELVSRIALGRLPEGLETLRSAAVRSINEAIENLLFETGFRQDAIIDCCLGGNTVMCWLFSGLDPTPLEYVDADVDTSPILLPAHVSGLHIHSRAWVWCLPAVSRYVGGDAVGDLIAANIDQSDDLCLMIDLGTNGEIILGNKDWLVSTSCASGPAFEGSGLCCGMRAMAGAIEHVTIDAGTGIASVTVIGNTLPKGICGSGIIDAAPAMVRAGILDFSGKLVEGAHGVKMTEYGPAYVLVQAPNTDTGMDIIITKQDMGYLMDTKAAICGAISVLLKKNRLSVRDVKQVYLAGAFGTYGSLENLTEFGIIPEFPDAEFHRIGNGSLTGAYKTLLSKIMRERAVRIAGKMAYIDLLVDSDFIEEYGSALRIPGKEELFPDHFRNLR